MARTKAFDSKDIQTQIMNLFWRHGFSSLGFETISKETGLSRSSLYAEFGNKKDLYLKCIALYLDEVLTNYENYLNAAEPSIENIERYFTDLDMSAHYHGCFMVKSISEVAIDMPVVRERMKSFLMKLEALFAENLKPIESNPDRRREIAAALLSFDLGYSILGMAWRSKDDYERSLKGILLILREMQKRKK